MKRKFPCSAHGGTSSGLARYSLGAGSKDWAEQRSSEVATKPTSPMFLTIRTRCRVPSLRNDQDHQGGHIIRLGRLVAASKPLPSPRTFLPARRVYPATRRHRTPPPAHGNLHRVTVDRRPSL